MVRAATQATLIELSRVKEEDPIILRVQRQYEADVCYWMGRNTPFEELISHYCHLSGLVPDLVRSLYEGRKLQLEKTPDDLMMEDEDIIDVFLELDMGGSYITAPNSSVEPVNP